MRGVGGGGEGWQFSQGINSAILIFASHLDVSQLLKENVEWNFSSKLFLLRFDRLWEFSFSREAKIRHKVVYFKIKKAGKLRVPICINP